MTTRKPPHRGFVGFPVRELARGWFRLYLWPCRLHPTGAHVLCGRPFFVAKRAANAAKGEAAEARVLRARVREAASSAAAPAAGPNFAPTIFGPTVRVSSAFMAFALPAYLVAQSAAVTLVS